MANSLTTTHYMLDGTKYAIDAQSKLGAGLEGTVFADPHNPDLCVKIFHPYDPSDQKSAKVAAYRAKKVLAICNLRLNLPARFALPLLPAYDQKGKQVIGFQMRRIPPNYFKLLKLLDSTFRTDQQVGLSTVAYLFANIFDDLQLIHRNGLVVGDINPGAVIFRPDANPERVEEAWVDTDSWSFPGYPCVATSELFAHPDLYPNLNHGAGVRPKPHHDLFGFTVAFTWLAIPGAHPFTMGSHPTAFGVQERAEAGLTVFDPSIDFPAILGSPDILSDDLINELVERLTRRNETALDPEMLRAFASETTQCRSCGTEYHTSRSQCPKCYELTLVQAPKLLSFVIEDLFKTHGALLFAQLVDTNLYLVCRLGSEVQVLRIDEQGAVAVMSPNLPSVPGARYRFFADSLVVCQEPNKSAPATLEMYRVEGTTLRQLDSTSSGVLEGESAVFDTSSRFLYRTASNTLMRSELFGAQGTVFDTAIAEVHQRQSWFTADHSTNADREVLFGYDRAFRNWQWFIIHSNAKGSHYQYYNVGDLGVRLGEKIEDFAVYFSASSVLLVMQTSYHGHDYVRYAVIGLDGTVHQNKTVNQSDASYPHWQQLRGKLYQGKSVLHVSPQGIVKQSLSDGSCTTLTDTTGIVTNDDRLIRLGKKVGIVRRGGVLAMTSKR